MSSGGNVHATIPLGPEYQVPLASQVRSATGLPTAAVGLITEPAQTAAILADGHADAVMLARVALREPAWPQRAAHALGLDVSEVHHAPHNARGAWPADQSPGVRARTA